MPAEIIVVILCQNVYPNNPLHVRKGGSHYALLSTIYAALKMNNSMRRVSTINPVATKTAADKPISITANTATGKPHCTIINCNFALSTKRTGAQRRTMMRVLYVLQLVKRYISGQSNVEQ